MSLDKKAILKEIEVLIRSIKVHYDNIENEYRIPTIELELITSKIRKLHEKSIIYNHIHYMEEEQVNIFKRAKFDKAILRPDLFEQSKEMSLMMNEAAIEVTSQAASNETIENNSATPDLIAEIEELIIHEPAASETLVDRKQSVEPTVLMDEVIPEPIKEEPIPEPIKEIPIAEPVKEEPVPEPVKAAVNAPKIEDEKPAPNYTSQDASFKRVVLSGKIGINDRFRFIKNLFGGNGVVMEASVQRIEACTSQQQFNDMIHELKSTFQWDEEEETVIDFYNLMK